MSARKKILLIAPGIPYPPVDGHKLKLYNLIKILKINYKINLVVITSETADSDAVSFLDHNCESYKIFKYPKFRFALNIFKGLINNKLPFQVAYYTFNSVKKYLKQSSDNYDHVFFNIIRTTGYFDIYKPQKVFIDMVDSIGINYLRSRKRTESLLYRTIYNLEANRLIYYERHIVAKARATMFVNKSEAASYTRHGNAKWIPNGVNEDLLLSNFNDQQYNNYVCFFGAMFYQPNIDAALWFIKNVLPKLDEGIIFCILGQRPSAKILKAKEGKNNIIVTGFLNNPYQILQSALCSVAPMQTGGGIQNKVLESMALGQITITNNLGSNPITGALNGKNILVANTPNEYVAIINALFRGDDSLKGVGQNAREFIKDNFSWDSYKVQLFELLDKQN